VRLRRATSADLDFLVELYADEDVRPFLAGGASYDRETLLDEIERLELEPSDGAILLVEVDGKPAAALKWRLESERHRIAHLGALAVHPAFRGRHLADEAARLLQRHLIVELGFHRLQLEVYGFNERGLRHADRAGFVREGVRRKAYLRGGDWVDGITFALVEEDLAEARNDSSSPPA